MKTRQILTEWTGDFGIEYTKRWDVDLESRNQHSVETLGQTMTESLSRVLGSTWGVMRILEVGSGLGFNLWFLSQLGKFELHGVEPQDFALNRSRERFPQFRFEKGDIFKLPYPDHYFDLVLTRMVLIHIHPDDLGQAMKEISRVSRRYIVGMEYHSSATERGEWRGKTEVLWKTDFERAYLDACPKLESAYSETIEIPEHVYGKRGLFYKQFVLKKTGA